MDEPRAYYTEWTESGRERHILYISTYVWNLERWYWRSDMQGSRGGTDIKNRLLDSVGRGEGGMIWESSTETYTLPCMRQIVSGSLYDTADPKSVLCDNLEGCGWEGSGRVMGDSGDRGHMYAYGWFMLMYGKNHPNIIKKVSSN